MTGASPPAGAAIVVLGAGALPLARRLRDVLPGSEIHAPAGKDLAADVVFARLAEHLGVLFAAGRPIVGLCAAGILIRALAPHLADKTGEPPVVAVAEDGSAAVPLLGGHRGANALARAIAAATGGVAAVTTASDVALGVALDEPPSGWRLANPEDAKGFAAALLAGAPVALAVEAGEAAWLAASRTNWQDAAARRICVTDRRLAGSADRLVYHPPVLALGAGCERGCTPEELIGLVEASLAAAGLAPGALALVVSLDRKADEPAVHALAARFGVPARFFAADELLAETPRLANPSAAVFRATGCYGVAEGAALAASGPAGRLVVAKQRSARATCAIARAGSPLDPAAIGRARGSLTVIGIGPGAAAARTHEADAALAEASDIVGYGLYLDLLGPTLAGKARHATGLGAEEERARLALDLAAQGRAVALVSSGDAGIYGLASLVFELLDREARADWRRPAIAVVPGVSAMQEAAARLGAPLGHDFCAISLSDLLTPWPLIARRLAAAGQGDFVVALYNPRSLRRPDRLAQARDILLATRAPATPVALARNLARAGEAVRLTTLGDLAPDAVDMLTLVLVGSSRTRLLAGPPPRLYTPRGYAAKRRAGGGE